MYKCWRAWIVRCVGVGALLTLHPALHAQTPVADRPGAAAPAMLRIFDPVVLPAGKDGRAILVRVTAPAIIRGHAPVILFSHGAALARGHYAPLVEAWARAGFVVLQPDHEDAVIDGFAPAVPPSAALWRTRIEDMRRLAHALPAIERAAPGLRGRLDAHRILAAGHSFGAHTVAALMGASVWDTASGRYESFSEPAIKGAVLLSPPGSGGDDLSPAFRMRAGYLKVDWSALHGPIMVMVGSADDNRTMSPRAPEWHADIYRHSRTKGMCLITLTGAKHYLGGIVDPRRDGVEDADPARLSAVRKSALALFRAALARRMPDAALFQPLGTPGDVECR